MKKYPFLILGYSALLCLASAQVPSVQIKVKQSSGFLGLGPARFIELQLSNQSGLQPLNSENVDGGQYYYFVVRPVGGWELQSDFVTGELPKLRLEQDGKEFSVKWNDDSIKEDSTTFILIGFQKDIRLHRAFMALFERDGKKDDAEFKVPMIYWPGYSMITRISKEVDGAASEQKYSEAIRLCNQILGNPSLEMFPEFSAIQEKRTKAFENLFSDASSTFISTAANVQLGLVDKIAQLDKCKPVLEFVADSLPNAALRINTSDSTIQAIVSRARDAVAQSYAVRDSLQVRLDEENTRWITQGSSSGRPAYVHQTMVKALAYAFSSLNFADTAMRSLNVTLSSELKAELTKYRLTEDYESFLRLCNFRFLHRQPFFPAEFLGNLRKDSVLFPLPYYSMLKTMNDFYNKDLSSARGEIFQIFRTCYDIDINTKFDQMRVLIDMKTGDAPAEALRLLDEARQAESQKDNQAAVEKYRQATFIAPNFAYAAFAFGNYYLRSGENIRALNFFQRAYQADKLYLTAYREAYNLYRRTGTYKPMIDVLTQALQNGNNYWEIQYNLGQAYMGDGDAARAIQHLEKALALNPNSYLANIHLGLAYQGLKKYKQAREFFSRAIDLDPQRQEAIDYVNKLNELERGTR